MKLFTKAFWLDVTERAVATGAQAVLTVLSLDGTNYLIVANFDWQLAVATFGFGAMFAVLKALVASGTGDKGTASLTDVVEYKTIK